MQFATLLRHPKVDQFTRSTPSFASSARHTSGSVLSANLLPVGSSQQRRHGYVRCSHDILGAELLFGQDWCKPEDLLLAALEKNRSSHCLRLGCAGKRQNMRLGFWQNVIGLCSPAAKSWRGRMSFSFIQRITWLLPTPIAPAVKINRGSLLEMPMLSTSWVTKPWHVETGISVDPAPDWRCSWGENPRYNHGIWHCHHKLWYGPPKHSITLMKLHSWHFLTEGNPEQLVPPLECLQIHLPDSTAWLTLKSWPNTLPKNSCASHSTSTIFINFPSIFQPFLKNLYRSITSPGLTSQACHHSGPSTSSCPTHWPILPSHCPEIAAVPRCNVRGSSYPPSVGRKTKGHQPALTPWTTARWGRGWGRLVVGGWWLGHPSEKESQSQKQKSCDVEQPCGKPNNSWLVALTILKNMKVNGKEGLSHIWNGK